MADTWEISEALDDQPCDICCRPFTSGENALWRNPYEGQGNINSYCLDCLSLAIAFFLKSSEAETAGED